MSAQITFNKYTPEEKVPEQKPDHYSEDVLVKTTRGEWLLACYDSGHWYVYVPILEDYQMLTDKVEFWVDLESGKEVQ